MIEADLALEDLKRLTTEMVTTLGPFAFERMIEDATAKIEKELARLRSLAGAVTPGPSAADIKRQCGAADAPA